jgi:hypothetical protein
MPASPRSPASSSTSCAAAPPPACRPAPASLTSCRPNGAPTATTPPSPWCRLRAGNLHRNRARLQPGRKIPHAGAGVVRRNRRPHARAHRVPRAGRTRNHRPRQADRLPREYKPYDTSFGDVPPLAAFGSGYRFHVTGLNKAAGRLPDHQGRVRRRRGASPGPQGRRQRCRHREERGVPDRRCRSAGLRLTAPPARSARYAVNELRKEGIKAGLFRPITLWPFPEKRIAELAKQARRSSFPK